ncbi:chondroitin sulfate synthase 1 [Phymastichus coffea]|uniref:chondroitin sulfate synthase 1 n=1 Tax=Phymastichus coffea TaxID=108790 RepID=UPI00273C1621|nr:chondroitin sulfate synthase 1 [Phymastichus coffea]
MRKRRGSLSSGLLGLAAGLLLGLLLLGQQQPQRPRPQARAGNASTRRAPPGQGQPEEDEQGGLLYVGVMTASKYLETRARAVHESWAREVPGRVGFYSSADSRPPRSYPQLPLVALGGVDDSYPPQKKSFLMLQHMWQRYGQRYEWFMRADDDVYVRMDRLEELLRSVDARRRARYIGQAGRGNSHEFGLLSLEYDENFCMGGPGVLLSREALRRVVPHIGYCLRNLYTAHEDVELGRCVRRFAGVACTWNYEMQSILYHNASGQLAFTGRLKSAQIHRAISMHPVKSAPHMYRLHNYVRALRLQELQQRSLELRGEAAAGRRPAPARPPPRWDLVARSQFSLGESNPRRRVRGDVREALEDATREVLASINACSRQRGRFVEERRALYGYRAMRPQRGALAVLDLLLMYRKYRGRKISLPVRRHLHLRQRFAGLERRLVRAPATEPPVHLVLPVMGRGGALRRFLETLERECLAAGEAARLIVVQYPGGEELADLEARLARLRARYGPEAARLVRPGGERFSRARALEAGLRLLAAPQLALLVDVDIEVGRGALARARRNALLGQRIYFPVVFSEFAPEMVGQLPPAERRPPAPGAGFWRQFGFGIVALYKRDYEAIGRLDLDIEGWGKEDVDLYEKAVRSGLEVFRAADPQLLHVHHGVRCDARELQPRQLGMCRGTRADTYASSPQLAGLLYREPRYLLFAANASAPSA